MILALAWIITTQLALAFAPALFAIHLYRLQTGTHR
jgi:hypothetical protein